MEGRTVEGHLKIMLERTVDSPFFCKHKASDLNQVACVFHWVPRRTCRDIYETKAQIGTSLGDIDISLVIMLYIGSLLVLFTPFKVANY